MVHSRAWDLGILDDMSPSVNLLRLDLDSLFRTTDDAGELSGWYNSKIVRYYCIHICIYAYTYIQTYAHTHTHAHAFKEHRYRYICIHIQMQIHIHTHIHEHTHIHKRESEDQLNCQNDFLDHIWIYLGQ